MEIIRKMMKVWEVLVLVAGCVALANAMSDEMQELIDSLHKQCIADTGASEDVIKQAQAGNFADDEKMRCYMKCVIDELGLISDDGKIDVEGMIAMLPDDVKDQMTPTIRKCAPLVGANPCETAFLMNKCCFETSPALYFLP